MMRQEGFPSAWSMGKKGEKRKNDVSMKFSTELSSGEVTRYLPTGS